MTILTNSRFTNRGPRDEHNFQRLLTALGKNEDYKLRAINNGNGKLINNDLAKAQALNKEGYGIYYVVNNGGEKDINIQSCTALFVEFDDKSKDFQLNFWKKYDLPEPTIQIHSGNRSIHSYWVFPEPMEPEEWKPLQRALVHWVGSDPSCINLSRCMRVPGFIHHKTGNRCQIMRCNGSKYKPELFKDLIPDQFLKPLEAKAEGFENWSDAIPCPICGRDDVDCREHDSGNVIQCHRGKRFHPPELAVGATVEGKDKRIWAYVGAGNNAVGPCSNFKIHESIHTPSPEVHKPRSLADELKNPRIQEWIIEDIIPKAAFVLLGAEAGAGKSTFLYRLAASVASGEPFARAFQVTKPGKVLILQADESKGDLQKKFARMELPEFALSNIHVNYLDPGFLGREQSKDWLVHKLRKENYSLILMDSMTTLFAGNGSSTKDAEFALPLYALTKTFDELDIACVVSDHLRKADIGGRSEVSMDCIRDSNMKMAAVTDVLGYWVDKEGLRILKALGKRNLSQGTTYTLRGSEEDLSLELLKTSTDLMPEQARNGKAKILVVINQANEPLDAEQVALLTGINSRHTQRLLLGLFELRQIRRVKLESQVKGGRPKYAYFSGHLPSPLLPETMPQRKQLSIDDFL